MSSNGESFLGGGLIRSTGSFLDRRCLTCSAQGQQLKGLASLDKKRWVARRRLISAHDDIHIEQAEFDASADATGLVGGDESSSLC